MGFLGQGASSAPNPGTDVLGDNDNTTIFRNRASAVPGSLPRELGSRHTACHHRSTCRGDTICSGSTALPGDRSARFHQHSLSSTNLVLRAAFLHGFNVGLEARW